MRGWREAGDGQLRGEAQLRRVGEFRVLGRAGDCAGRIRPFDAQLVAAPQFPGYEPQEDLALRAGKRRGFARGGAGLFANRSGDAALGYGDGLGAGNGGDGGQENEETRIHLLFLFGNLAGELQAGVWLKEAGEEDHTG